MGIVVGPCAVRKQVDLGGLAMKWVGYPEVNRVGYSKGLRVGSRKSEWIGSGQVEGPIKETGRVLVR